MDEIDLTQLVVHLANKDPLKPFTFFSKSQIAKNINLERNLGVFEDQSNSHAPTVSTNHTASSPSPSLPSLPVSPMRAAPIQIDQAQRIVTDHSSASTPNLAVFSRTPLISAGSIVGTSTHTVSTSSPRDPPARPMSGAPIDNNPNVTVGSPASPTTHTLPGVAPTSPQTVNETSATASITLPAKKKRKRSVKAAMEGSLNLEGAGLDRTRKSVRDRKQAAVGPVLIRDPALPPPKKVK